MIKAIVFDFSRVLLFPINKNYKGSLNELHKGYMNKSDYKVFDLFELNIDLLTFLDKIMHRANLYILTSDIIQESPEFEEYLKPKFKKIYSASKMGHNKKESKIYEDIAKDLRLNPENILVVDDSIVNVKAAREAGMETIQYQSNKPLFDFINQKLAW
jgi:HAD superfamily hydrolase (TIGR01549 family)